MGKSKFLSMEGLPSDHYLWLTGQGAKLLRGEVEATELGNEQGQQAAPLVAPGLLEDVYRPLFSISMAGSTSTT